MDSPLIRHPALPAASPPTGGPGHVATTASICCYCGTGCGVRVHTEAGRVTGVSGDNNHPSSLGKLCSKGRSLADTVRDDGARVLHAQWRDPSDRGNQGDRSDAGGRRNAPRQKIALDAAMDLAADRLADIIRRHGPDAVAFYLSGQLLTEDYAVFNKLARALVGTNNVDTNSRLCMSSAVAGYKQTLGADAPPACYDDLGLADTVLIAGSNAAHAHPILFRRLEAAKQARPDMKIILVDPRRTDTAELADLHLPILPGSDVALFHAMLHVMQDEGLLDHGYIERHTTGYAALRERIAAYPPAVAQELCGVPAADIVQAARWFGRAGAALSLYTMGLNQSSSGTAKNATLIHLHLATGQIGKPGAGPFSLTGQPNAMGGREAGGMATLLPGHRDPANAAHRAEVAALWGVPQLPEQPGLPALEMFDALLDGRIKAIWIAATNPAQSLPDQARVRAALAKAELVIVQEAFTGGETLDYADLVLPAATWPEKEGTVTNSERRISRVRAAIAAPGDAQPDWRLASAIARRLAARIAPERADLFDYADEAAVFAEHAATTAGRDLDYSALTYRILDEQGPQQWPYRPGLAPSRRLYTDGVFATADGRARFVDVGYVPVAEPVTAEFPLRLTTGRLRDHWHTMARTALSPALVRHVEAPWLSLHPDDMRELGLVDNDAAGSGAAASGATASGAAGLGLATVRSRRGEIVLPVRADPALRRGHAWLPMHWGSAFMAGDGINALTNPARDPVSRQPELKHCAIAVAPAALPWQAAGWVRGDAAALRRALAPWLRRFPYAVLLPSASAGGGLSVAFAAAHAPAVDVLAALFDEMGLAVDPGLATAHERESAPRLAPQHEREPAHVHGPEVPPRSGRGNPPSGVRLRADAVYDDPARGKLRRVALDQGRPRAFLLAGDLLAHDALIAWADGGDAPASVARLLMGRNTAPPRARTICVCVGVTDRAIEAGIANGLDLEGLKKTLGCATGCGSCAPEISRMVTCARTLKAVEHDPATIA
ncbi:MULTISPECIES: nitrate reductase [unclassified Achromobacter]|uniref:nitrate reductase n=1 Tax=unclassified Achromobacter TaxID=2626865 RepID=UPI000B5187B0|nr:MULTISPECIES: nitrate reductase [unclassified Achromobacter]OWT69182.1 nitrate reductase [Achromobacter sp. HZ34]OWT70587.1 nitrate reductase [Achromobacter sp. HZ28]